MDHFVKLDRLPDGYDFPADLKDRIWFDAAAHKLGYHGYMSKADFDRLSQPTRDWGFRRALEDLFRQCVPEVGSAPQGSRRLLGVFTRLIAPR
ncbi:MAG TPA: hypothetical protein VFF52_09090 [Isosphaeraceae bacterium]|nr:hypothetical protein [Isosphaeraceae bacterium]